MINKQLDTLFKRWEKAALNDGHTDFCKDGLIVQESNYQDVWNKSERRVVFILKEFLTDKQTDLRQIILKNRAEELTDKLSGNRMAAWLYGLYHTNNDGYPSVEKAFDAKTQQDTIHNIPFSIVGINKQAQSENLSNADIYQYAERYKQYLKEELAILNSNVCVCCGEVVFKILKNIIFPHSPFIKVNEWVYYERYTQTIIINSYLPNSTKSNKELYNTMMEKLIEGLRIPTAELGSLDTYVTSDF